MFFLKPKADAGTSDRSPWGNFWFSANPGNARVTAATATGLTVVYACVKVLAESFAVMPYRLYKPTSDGKRGPRVTNHWSVKRFSKAPNKFQSPYEWRLMLMGHLALRGNAFCQIDANGRGDITSLLPLHPDRMQVELLDNGNYRFKYTTRDGETIRYRRDEIWHLRAMSDDGIVGISPIEQCAQAIGEGLSMQSYSSRFFANDAKPGGGWIEVPGSFANTHDKQTFRDSWQTMQGGANRGKVAVLEKGMKFHELSLTNSDAQFVEARAAKVTDLCRIFRVPPHLIQDLSRCMPGDTSVFTTSGPKRIDEVQVGESVWSFDGDKIVESVVTSTWDKGVAEVIEIRTTNRVVRCTDNHRLLVRRPVDVPVVSGRGGKNVGGKKFNVQWVTEYVGAGELRTGDTLVTLDSLPDQGGTVAPNGRVLTVGFMEFAGLLAGDGNVLDGAVTIARAPNAKYMDHYRKVMADEFTCGGREYASGDAHVMAKLSVEQVDAIRALTPRIRSVAEISRGYGVNVCTGAKIARGGAYDENHPQAAIGGDRLVSMRKAFSDRLTCDQVGEQFGVSGSTVANIISGRSWAVSGTVDKVRPVSLHESRMATKFSSVSAVAELRDLGLGGTAYTKTVPRWVFGLSEELRLAYLRGIVDSDGTIDKKGRISVSLCNESMINELRHLAMSCGVPVTNVRMQVANPTTPDGTTRVSVMYSFTCSDAGANRRIGSHDPRYVERLAAATPFGRKDRAYPRFGGIGFDAEGVSLARISEIKRLPAERVYDIEVAENHCFVANGVVSHNSTFSNIEQQSIEFWTNTMLPWAELWESSIEFHLLGEDTMFEPEFNMDRMLRGDSAARTAYYTGGITGGWLTRNEAREMEGLDPLDDLDEPLVPLNMVSADKLDDPDAAEQDDAPDPATEPAEPAEPEDGKAARLHTLLNVSAGRMARRLAKGDMVSAELLAEALAVTPAAASHWLISGAALLDEAAITASLLELAQ